MVHAIQELETFYIVVDYFLIITIEFKTGQLKSISINRVST